jgi:multidrug efflux system outer membrane protein
MMYYAKGVVSPIIILWLMIALLTIPLVIMSYKGVASMVAESLTLGAAVALIVAWISYALFPDSLAEGEKAKPAQKPVLPSNEERFENAIKSTIVVFPLLLFFYFFELSGALLVLIYTALLSSQPQFAKDFKSGKALIIGNFIGGVVAMIIYEVLVIVPEYFFMLIIVLLLGLLFGKKLFSGDKKGALFGMAYSTFILIIGSVTGTFNEEANVKVYSRVFEIMAAVTYIVVAFGALEHFRKMRKEKKLIKIRKKIILTSLFALFMSACTMGPNYTRPPVPAGSEEFNYKESFPSSETIADLPWWEMFGDTVLQNLISEALENNRDLRSAMARIDEARANLGIVRADLYPRVDYMAKGSYDGTFNQDNSEADLSGSGALDVSYQVDLWGRIRRANEAAQQEFLATEEAYRGITISLVAEVASAYLLLRDIDNRLLIAEQTAEARRKSLDVINARYDAGIVSEVDVNQSEIQLADAEASVKNFERLRAQTENAISLLLSKPPMTIERGKALEEQIFPPEIPVGLPSTLLNRRPDLLEAEKKLHAQTARIGVAEALKYPQLTLSADLGVSFSSLTTGFAGLGAQIFGPLFNANANEFRVEVEKARTEQLLNRYEQTFFTALREVEDAMVAVKTYKEEYKIRKAQVNSAKNAADLSWVRYEGGMTSYLEVLDLQRSLFTAQLKSSETLQFQLSSIIKLYKALGGGWVAEQDSTNGLGSMKTELKDN